MAAIASCRNVYGRSILRWSKFRMPCGPSRISLKKLSSATHTMGDTSTPPTGGIARRVGPSTGSVGLNASDHGSLPPSSCEACLSSAALWEKPGDCVAVAGGNRRS